MPLGFHRRRALRPCAFAFVCVSLLGAAGTLRAEPDAPPVPLEQHTEKPLAELEAADETHLTASLGGSLATGNTRAFQVNVGSALRLIRDPHAVSANATFAYGEADIPGDDTEAYQPTVRNFNARARYDYFLTRMDGVFVASAFRWDQFAGLDARIQGQLGYLRYFHRRENHRFWGEVGYDITYDDYHRLPNPADPTMLLPGGDDLVHSARGFLGYENKLNQALTYVGGIEALVNVEGPRDTRIAFDNALRSAIGGHLQLELRFTVLFDNVPVPGARRTDTATVVNLIYNLL